LDFIAYPPSETDCFGKGKAACNAQTRTSNGADLCQLLRGVLSLRENVGSNQRAVKGNEARCATIAAQRRRIARGRGRCSLSIIKNNPLQPFNDGR
jgi:hypothetical protein